MLKTVDKTDKSEEAKELRNTVSNIEEVISKADVALEKMSKAQDNWLLNGLMKLVK